ncbi:MAG: LemA family protein [Deltaproteobacteria bacterium]|nr:LemA family protein [Deltaproteobacteria bacterium]
MKRNTSVGLLMMAVILAIFAGTCAVQYNSLVRSSETVDGAWSQVENVLQRRADLIPNLVETVKGYASHERAVFTEVANARSRLLAAQTPAEAEAGQQGLNAALGRLLVIAERYPELKADQSFIRLQDELAGTENRIAVERMRYNDTVRAYNTRIRRFPTNVIASVAGFDRKAYFEAAPGSREVPRVQFDRGETSSRR